MKKNKYKNILYIFSIFLIVYLAVGCSSNTTINKSNISYFQNVSNVKFTQQWKQLIVENKFFEEDKFIQIEDFKIKIINSKSFLIDEMRLQWKELQSDNTYLVREMTVSPQKQGLNVSRGWEVTDENQRIKYHNISIQKLMTILDDIGIAELIKSTFTEAEFYNIELFGGYEQGDEIYEQKEPGELVGEEIDKETGETYRDYYNHKYFIYKNGSLIELGSKDKYVLEKNAVSIVIVPMKKINEKSYKGVIEVEVIYELLN